MSILNAIRNKLLARFLQLYTEDTLIKKKFGFVIEINAVNSNQPFLFLLNTSDSWDRRAFVIML
jgi:hypothetical protein